MKRLHFSSHAYYLEHVHIIYTLIRLLLNALCGGKVWLLSSFKKERETLKPLVLTFMYSALNSQVSFLVSELDLTNKLVLMKIFQLHEKF